MKSDEDCLRHVCDLRDQWKFEAASFFLSLLYFVSSLLNALMYVSLFLYL